MFIAVFTRVMRRFQPAVAALLVLLSTLSGYGQTTPAGITGDATLPACLIPCGESHLTVIALIHPDGSVSGHVTGTAIGGLPIIGNSSGPVVSLVPPIAGSAVWCMVYSAPSGLVTLWINDIGDGVSSFDQIWLEPGSVCSPSLPAFQEIFKGDFRTIP